MVILFAFYQSLTTNHCVPAYYHRPTFPPGGKISWFRGEIHAPQYLHNQSVPNAPRLFPHAEKEFPGISFLLLFPPHH